MVTGDQRLIAVETCRRLGMGTNIMEGANLMQGDCTDADLATKVGSSLQDLFCTAAEGPNVPTTCMLEASLCKGRNILQRSGFVAASRPWIG